MYFDYRYRKTVLNSINRELLRLICDEDNGIEEIFTKPKGKHYTDFAKGSNKFRLYVFETDRKWYQFWKPDFKYRIVKLVPDHDDWLILEYLVTEGSINEIPAISRLVPDVLFNTYSDVSDLKSVEFS